MLANSRMRVERLPDFPADKARAEKREQKYKQKTCLLLDLSCEVIVYCYRLGLIVSPRNCVIYHADHHVVMLDLYDAKTGKKILQFLEVKYICSANAVHVSLVARYSSLKIGCVRVDHRTSLSCHIPQWCLFEAQV